MGKNVPIQRKDYCPARKRQKKIIHTLAYAAALHESHREFLSKNITHTKTKILTFRNQGKTNVSCNTIK